MEHRKTVGEWLDNNFMWRIPVYQRHYAWDAKDKSGPIHLFWDTVKEQTQARLNGETPRQHYLGAVLVDNQTERGATDDIKVFDVVDGQQRLTTIQIALLALIKVAKAHGEDIKQDLEKYTLSDSNPQTLKSRLFPTNFDAQQFQYILYETYTQLINFSNNSPSAENATKSKIAVTFELLQKECNNLVEKNKEHEARSVIDAIKATLTDGFDLVLIVLLESDDAQRIFESLNNYAQPLTTFDLIRNNVFYRAAKDGKDVDLFYKSAWKQLEHPYWEEKSGSRADGKTHIEAYIARMLVAKLKKEVHFNRNDIFYTYKADFLTNYESIDEEIKNLVSYTDIYQYLYKANGSITVGEDNFTDADFGIFLYKAWNNRDFYPVIFSILDSNASKEDKCRMIKLLESYVIRRGVCALSANHYNKYAVSICEILGDNPSYHGLEEMLTSAHSDTTLFPTDDGVIRGCATADFYKKVPFSRYVLNQIENSMYVSGDERNSVDVTQLTIDHILPQEWEKNAEWKKMVLSDASNPHEEALVAKYIHTIGNLTIMSRQRNSAKSNHSFEEKKDLFASSPLKLNKDLAKKDTWNVEQITQRSKELAEKICEIWPYNIPE